MPRAKGQNAQQRRVRTALEDALCELVDTQQVTPLIRLRIEQAIRRADLGCLLQPALDDLERLACDVSTAKDRVNAAVATLLGDDDAPLNF